MVALAEHAESSAEPRAPGARDAAGPLAPGARDAAGPLAPGERRARAALRDQVSRLERLLADTLASGFPHTVPDVRVPGRSGPRVLALGELEGLRDELAARLRAARAELAAAGERHEAARLLLEDMLLAPGRHRFVRLPNAELGEGGCGVWQVRPRLGLVGMLMGWWQVKLSSGCPRPARGRAPRRHRRNPAPARRSRFAAAGPERRIGPLGSGAHGTSFT